MVERDRREKNSDVISFSNGDDLRTFAKDDDKSKIPTSFVSLSRYLLCVLLNNTQLNIEHWKLDVLIKGREERSWARSQLTTLSFSIQILGKIHLRCRLSCMRSAWESWESRRAHRVVCMSMKLQSFQGETSRLFSVVPEKQSLASFSFSMRCISWWQIATETMSKFFFHTYDDVSFSFIVGSLTSRRNKTIEGRHSQHEKSFSSFCFEKSFALTLLVDFSILIWKSRSSL